MTLPRAFEILQCKLLIFTYETLFGACSLFTLSVELWTNGCETWRLNREADGVFGIQVISQVG